jgi:hypothetical protein
MILNHLRLGPQNLDRKRISENAPVLKDLMRRPVRGRRQSRSARFSWLHVYSLPCKCIFASRAV